MLYLKCTAEAQKAVGLRKENLAVATDTSAPLGNWYVNRFVADRRKIFIFMSENTLLSFILFQGKKQATAQTLPNMLLAGLQQLLEMRGLPITSIDRAFEHYDSGAFARTDDRSTLGSLNDLVQGYQHRIEYDGGLARCDLSSIIMSTNDMPQRKLGWASSWDITQSKLMKLS